VKGTSGKTQEIPDRSIINRRLIRERGSNPGQEAFLRGAIRKNIGNPGQEHHQRAPLTAKVRWTIC
jgi:hypothetical protein